MKYKVYAKGRKWLNPIDSYNSGAVQYKVSADKPWREGYVDINAELSIWDCSRKITLDFNVEDAKSAKIVAQKIKSLQDALQCISTALGKAYEESINSEITTEDY